MSPEWEGILNRTVERILDTIGYPFGQTGPRRDEFAAPAEIVPVYEGPAPRTRRRKR